eukprot:3577092-Rhodomonas_salina.1
MKGTNFWAFLIVVICIPREFVQDHVVPQQCTHIRLPLQSEVEGSDVRLRTMLRTVPHPSPLAASAQVDEVGHRIHFAKLSLWLAGGGLKEQLPAYVGQLRGGGPVDKGSKKLSKKQGEVKATGKASKKGKRKGKEEKEDVVQRKTVRKRAKTAPIPVQSEVSSTGPEGDKTRDSMAQAIHASQPNTLEPGGENLPENAIEEEEEDDSSRVPISSASDSDH